MINVFNNESHLIGDRIKETFYKKYKNVELTLAYNEFNELLQGIDFNIYDVFSKTTRRLYISAYDYNTISEFYSDATTKIDGVIRNISRKNYFK